MSTPTFQMFKTRVAMNDDRVLTYYDFATPGTPALYLAQHQQAALAHPPGAQRVLPNPPIMRWNPTIAEWTVYAANRMNRPQLPSKGVVPALPWDFGVDPTLPGGDL